MSPEEIAAGGKVAVPQKHGGISTEKTISFEADGRHYVIPTIINGVSYEPQAAIDAFYSNQNKPLGVFDTADAARIFAEDRSRSLDVAFGGSGRLMKGDSQPLSGVPLAAFLNPAARDPAFVENYRRNMLGMGALERLQKLGK